MEMDSVVGAAAVFGTVVAVATFALNRRDRGRADAAAVFVIVKSYQTRMRPESAEPPSEGFAPHTAVTVHNAGALPITAVKVALFEWGRRRRLWRFRRRRDAWTGARVQGRMFSTIEPECTGERCDLPPVAMTPPAFQGESPHVILEFRDGYGRSWIRWPDGRLSRAGRDWPGVRSFFGRR